MVVLGTIKARGPRQRGSAGQTLTRLEVTADVVAASLQWTPATLTKAPRSGRSSTAGEPDAEQAPF
ncbi:MAG TPA: hypothetical protein VGH76_05640 [Actinomycetospora sp.]|uniref:hypothetical protein n=1 Tax=Actinomycetospora sp. TaxID=1872135 RepID=UPI002F419B77